MGGLAASAALQVGIAIAIAWVCWLGAGRLGTLRAFLGIYAAPRRSLWVAALVCVPFAAQAWLTHAIWLDAWPDLAAVLRGDRSPLRPIAGATSFAEALLATVFYACVQTAASEEILFRGLLAKRLFAKLPFGQANALQALAFAAAHNALLLAVEPGAGLGLHALFFALPLTMGLAGGYLNERLAGGSIAPSWLIHAGANLAAGLAFHAYAAA